MKTSFSGVFWGFVSICVGCFLAASSWYAYLDYRRVQGYMGIASGEVTKKNFQTTADGSGSYYLDYSFVPAAGNKISATGIISRQQWDNLQVNDKLAIIYDPSNPNRNIPLYGSNPSLVFSFFMLILGAVFFLFGISRFLNSFKIRKSRA